MDSNQSNYSTVDTSEKSKGDCFCPTCTMTHSSLVIKWVTQDTPLRGAGATHTGTAQNWLARYHKYTTLDIGESDPVSQLTKKRTERMYTYDRRDVQ
jgi:hypothetical protein